METGRYSPRDHWSAKAELLSLCPDPEVLAALVDQGLGAAERTDVEAHLAGCDDCRILLAHVLETQHAVVESANPANGLAYMPERTRPSRPWRSSMRWGVGAVLAAAATLLVAVQMPRPWLSAPSNTVESRLADLVDAVGQERTVEGRLTGGFRHGPLRAPVRSGGSTVPTDNWTLYAAAGKIREDAEREPSAANLHALGLAHLILGDHDAAVQALEDAAAEDAQSAPYLSDLSAAYFARSRQLDRPDDLPRALGAADRAINADPTLLEARFNRGLALEALFLEEQARRAWEDYVSRDSSSPWAEEAKRRLAALQQSAAEHERERNNSPPLLTANTVEAGLDWLVRHGLPAWADAVLASDAIRASQEHSTITTYAEQISKASSDPFAVAIVNVDGPRDGTAMSHARFIKRLAPALGLIDDERLAEGVTALTQACDVSAGPLQLLCEIELGTMDLLRRDFDASQRRSASALQQSMATGYKYIEGRARRLATQRYFYDSNYAAVLDGYRVAFDIFHRSSYLAQAGFLAAQIGEVLDVMGLPVDSWQWRRKGLELASLSRSSKSQYFASMIPGAALARAGDVDASGDFFDTPSVAQAPPPLRATLLMSRAQNELQRGDVAAARDTVDETYVALEGDMRSAYRLSNVDEVRALVLAAEGRVGDALGVLDTAIARIVGPERQLLRLRLLLHRAGLRAKSPADVDAAEADIRQALQLLSAQVAAGQSVQVADAALASQAIATLVTSSPRMQSEHGLLLAQQFREVLDGVAAGNRIASPGALNRALQRFQGSTVGIFYLLGDDGLSFWVLADGHATFARRGVSAQAIAARCAQLGIQLARAPEQEGAWIATLTNLHDLLLRDVVPVRGATELVVIADGPLQRVPFGSLVARDTGQFLFERTAVRVASNLAFAVTPSVPAGTTSVLTIGEPDITEVSPGTFAALPKARREAVAVAALYPKSEVLLAERATKSRVIKAMATAQVIHFAGHAVANGSVAPRLLLAGPVTNASNSLSLGDLTFRLSGTRVVLAACDTAVGQSGHRASGSMTLAAEFVRAGASAVVATLWKVDDSASEPFFLDVHRGLAAGQSTAQAVAAAQRKCRGSSACRSSAATWIGTTVFGNE